jgi:hypothetical protein
MFLCPPTGYPSERYTRRLTIVVDYPIDCRKAHRDAAERRSPA